MRIVVLGAGVIGVTSAWFLARAGHEVTVIDRQPAPALETSFANGGQVGTSHAQPWASPSTLRRLPGWLLRGDGAIRFQPQADARQWSWGLRFLLECGAARSHRNMRRNLALARYSQGLFRELRDSTGIAYDHVGRGILHIHTDRAAFEHARAGCAALVEAGMDVRMVDAGECRVLEPALATSGDLVAGGMFAAADESGDARAFTAALAALAAQAGVAFRFDTSIERLAVDKGALQSVVVRNPDGSDDRVRGDACVVALGSYSALLLASVGMSVPVYPVKGHSITVALAAADVAPTLPLHDEGELLVFSRLGNRLRVAGAATLQGYDTAIDQSRIDALTRRTAQLFPGIALADDKVTPWTGLRPATPSNVPCIGATRVRGLWLNTGHGTLGWTLSCGSAGALAELIDGRRPPVDFPFLGK